MPAVSVVPFLEKIVSVVLSLKDTVCLIIILSEEDNVILISVGICSLILIERTRKDFLNCS